MVLALPVGLGVLLGLAARGSLRAMGTLRLRRVELFYLALALQVVAFPFPFLPWTTNDQVATTMWLASYAMLGAAAIANRGIIGVPVIAAGMASNVIAVVANGRHMPALPQALRAAHKNYVVHFNSAASASPRVPWLVDRWAVPRWIHLGNVYSIGDVVIAVGVVLVVVAAMEPRLPLPRRRGQSAVSVPQVVVPAAFTPPAAPVDLEPISPELALVCPELAERVRKQLPARPWEMFLPAPPPAASVASRA
ncbi:MAG: DUF5317 family protein [Gaiellaceae bacterium]